MAREIELTHPSGLVKKGYVGFSWTSLFFGPFPALFRGDWLGFFSYVGLALVLAAATAMIGNVIQWFVWPIFYNRWFTKRLIESGYVISDGSDKDPSIRAQLSLKS